MTEIELQGSPVSEGIAIGVLCFIEERKRKSFPDFAIRDGEVDREIVRYRKALSSSRKDLMNLQNFLFKEGSEDAIGIIDSHIQMLDDPLMTTVMEEQIRGLLRNTESVFNTVMSGYEKQFSRISDTFFKQRLIDVKDLSQRILRHLSPEKGSKKNVPNNGIVCARELIPSDTAEAPTDQIAGFISETGGVTSHASLIARAKGIPYISHVDFDTLFEYGEIPAIIDGKKGIVILNPQPDTLDHYNSLRNKIAEEEKVLKREVTLNTATIDGCPIEVSANIDSLEDLDIVHEGNPSSIGLFRTENLFLNRNLLESTVEEQTDLYSEAIRKANGLPITFRIFDIGSDKSVLREIWAKEPNPALGCRAIRFLLKKKELLITQLRALLLASHKGEIRLLIPLITDVKELKEVKKIFLAVKKELGIERYIPIGAMIEVPSAVLTCDAIAKECDFLSIGTNDLVQYTLAADRCNPYLTEFYKPVHPSVIKILAMAVNAAMRQQTPISLCGEMASNPRFIPFLIGLGITSFSCSSRYIPQVKKCIRDTTFQTAQSLAHKLLTLDSTEEVERFI